MAMLINLLAFGIVGGMCGLIPIDIELLREMNKNVKRKQIILFRW
jgi:hypothetical protein